MVDVFSEYPTKDVVLSILALSRLQRAVYASKSTINYRFRSIFDEDEHDEVSGGSFGTELIKRVFHRSTGKERSIDTASTSDNDILNIEYDLLADLAHYAIFANAAYGWKMGLLGGKLHLGDLKTLLRRTGIEAKDVIETSWKAKTHLPAYFLVRDVHKKKIVLCIRGTLSPKDILTDLCCTAEDFLSHEEEQEAGQSYSETTRSEFKAKYRARAHQGMVNAARGVANMTHELIRAELESNPEYNLVLVGHSLGGGVASILGTFWRDTFPGLNVYAYGCPCVAPLNAYPTIDESIISVVGEGDPFSCLSLGHLADVSTALSILCKDVELRNQILNRTTESGNDEMTDNDMIWCKSTLDSLTQQSPSEGNMTTEKFYPPGRVLHMKGNLFGSDLDEVTLTEVRSEDIFRHLKLHSRMFDLSLHIPHRYEVLLSRIWSKVKKKQ